jgi:16S rRNA (uracil1498-N3)-methyltransferase
MKFMPDAPARFVTLYQSLIKKDNFELVLQKGTELGIKIFVPVLAARSVKIKDEVPARWFEIVREAAEQCGRTELPELKPIAKFKDAIKNYSGIGLLAHEEEKDLPIQHLLGGEKNLSIFIGPEGGFSPEEITLAKSSRIKPVSLGKNILRAETAAIAASALALLD